MKNRIHILAALLIAILLISVSSGMAQRRVKMTASELLTTLKPGQWVKLEGKIQKDFSVLCKEVEVKALSS